MNHVSNLNLIRNSINSAQMAFLPWEVSTATDTQRLFISGNGVLAMKENWCSTVHA